MIVNIHDYVDRYISDYVFYHWQHFSEDAPAAAYLFQGKYQEALDDLGAAALGSEAQANMFNGGDKESAAASLHVADVISDGAILEQTLDEIAASLNSAIDHQVASADLMNIYKQSLTFANMFENGGNVQYATVRQFLSLLTSALDLAGGYNASFLDELRRFGKAATGKKFNFNPGNAKLVSQEQLAILSKIQDTLANARYKFLQSGKELSAASFRGTIVYIFRVVLAQALAQSMLSTTVQYADSQIDDIMASLGFKVEQGKTSKPASSASKTSIINTKGLQLEVVRNGQTAIIEIGTDLQVQSVDVNKSRDVSIIARSTIGNMYAAGSPIRYYAANLIAHRDTFEEEYNVMRAATAASFVRNSMFGANKAKVSQFLLVNGHVYPILTIVKNICNEYMRNSGNMASFGVVIQELDRGSNKWLTDGDNSGPSIQLALIRSQLVNNIINKLVINLQYNNNILNNYINKI